MKIKKILFYGQGNGRDHANHISAIASEDVEVFSLIQNENALMEKSKNVIRIKNLEEALKFAKKFQPDLVVISNRADLSKGIAEIFENEGYNVFGVSKQVAKLETSKEFAKEFMVRNNIRTPKYFVANNQEEAIDYIIKNWNNTEYGFVFKVDQFSKNSFERTAVPESLEEAQKSIFRLFNSTPNAKLIIEEKIKGYELSLHVLIKGEQYSILPMVQDYKKKYPNNEGPMTAGTASVAKSMEYPKQLLEKLKQDIIEPTIKGFIKEGIKYDYILYIGVMVTPQGVPYILEYNTRTGNPEWPALLGLLNRPLTELLNAYYNNIENITNYWYKDLISVTMYGFSSGYPETIRSSFEEEIMNLNNLKKDTTIIGEHIIQKDNVLYPDGGRVFALRRTGKEFDKVKKELIEDFYMIKMNGLYFRSDIQTIKLN